MPAGSALSKTPNLGSSGGGVLARNLSPDKSRRGVTSLGGAGDVEMAVKARRWPGEDHGSFTSSSGMYSIGSSEAFDVEDANQRIAAPKVRYLFDCWDVLHISSIILCLVSCVPFLLDMRTPAKANFSICSKFGMFYASAVLFCVGFLMCVIPSVHEDANQRIAAPKLYLRYSWIF